jgi:anti-sigma B factor antagonist
MGVASLTISESVRDGVTILELKGDIDAHTSPHLKEAIDKAIALGKLKIVFDFTNLNYISSAGIGVLNAALNVLKGRNGKMAIAGASKAVRDTLEVMYFTRKVDLFPSVGEAVKLV